MEIPFHSLIHAQQALSTITSPSFFEIVVIFSENETGRPSESLAGLVRELYVIKEFSVAFCMETLLETSRAENQRKLTLETERAVAAGLYGFLPRPPLVFFRRLVSDVVRYTS